MCMSTYLPHDGGERQVGSDGNGLPPGGEDKSAGLRAAPGVLETSAGFRAGGAGYLPMMPL
jgi:hypothetical protein